MLELDKAVFSVIQKIPEDAAIGTELFRMQLDSYENSLRHVGTHLLMKDLSSESVWDALNAGRAFVAFDWMADSTGFDWVALDNGQRIEMGSECSWKQDMLVRGSAPHSVRWKVIRNGKQVYESTAEQISYRVAEPGIYRAEAWLDLAGTEQVWVLSNPIYLRE